MIPFKNSVLSVLILLGLGVPNALAQMPIPAPNERTNYDFPEKNGGSAQGQSVIMDLEDEDTVIIKNEDGSETVIRGNDIRNNNDLLPIPKPTQNEYQPLPNKPSPLNFPPGVKKPNIYLYPTKRQEVSVKLEFQGTLTTTYPLYNEEIKGWKVIAHPDGHLINLADKQTYSYLFWEGVPNDPFHNLTTGFVVEGKDTAKFLQKTLKEIGLTPKEYNEFIVFWLPKMEGNNFNLIHFAGTEYTDRAPLTIEPKPDSLLRVFMAFKPLETKIDVAPQKLVPFVRKGFAVIEWGGTEIKIVQKESDHG